MLKTKKDFKIMSRSSASGLGSGGSYGEWGVWYVKKDFPLTLLTLPLFKLII